ncbi:EI24 domain-containing protein [Paracoccus spongiarum]|uniref:EI24 domain-containing protein n=1 Tax=Paracoccus spongiarum TaxID=3064387 RepID=A0ABT9JD19_9RHOB|nr:EI24 domain-containing protein [Paracoccus sp. 2205BS29-5]MDP5307705.1 EI24 domain-containing protein [Paracoccus sp. 2205BS29-5]
MRAFRALALGWADLLRPRILSLALMGMGLTLALFVGLQALVFWLIRLFTPGSLSLPWLGTIDVGSALSWGSLALFPVMGFFLMAPVAAGFAGLFAERVAEAVEAIHYPQRKGAGLDFLDGLLESLAIMAAVIGVALLSLVLTPLLGPLAPLLFYGANGWLLGREFFQMAARRHLAEPHASELRRRHGGTVTLAGAMVAIALTIPVVNIAVPLLAAAAFTHLFHILSGTSGQAVPDRRG